MLRQYGVSRVVGDRYAGLTLASQFQAKGIAYDVAKQTTSELYEALEPPMNSHQVVLLDAPTLEQQLLGLVWRGGKVGHQPGEHDDHATAAAGVVELILGIGMSRRPSSFARASKPAASPGSCRPFLCFDTCTAVTASPLVSRYVDLHIQCGARRAFVISSTRSIECPVVRGAVGSLLPSTRCCRFAGYCSLGGHDQSSGDVMFLSFALFEAIDVTGRVESFFVFSTDAPHMVVDRLREVEGMSGEQQVDLGALRFYTGDAGLKIQRLCGQYRTPVFQRMDDRIRLEIEHQALPTAEDTLGYYAFLLPADFYGHVHPSLKASMQWLSDTRRLLVSGEILDQRGYRTKDLRVWAELRKGAEPDSNVPRINSGQVYADWSGGPHHKNVRAFIRAANASISSSAAGVFICHSHEDKPFARRLAIAIAGSGFKVWLDEAEIRVGESLIGKIETGIAQATHLIAVVSKASVTSRWCQEELRMALNRQILAGIWRSYLLWWMTANSLVFSRRSGMPTSVTSRSSTSRWAN